MSGIHALVLTTILLAMPACGDSKTAPPQNREPDACEQGQDPVGSPLTTPGTGALREEILGGAPSTRSQWPWLGRLELDGQHHCSAVLLNVEWLVTAAHCIERADGRHLEAIFGDYDVTAREETEQRFQLAETIIHPDYDSLGGALSDHDVAVVRLDHPAVTTNAVQTIGIAECANLHELWLTGWGDTGSGDSDVPMDVSTLVAPIRVCEDHLARLDASQQQSDVLCVGGEAGTPGACHRDSGSPAMFWVQHSGWQLAGIVIGGGPQCDEFTIVQRMNPFKQWITSQMTP
jgi:secreted trypsin-like serine protease